MSVSHDHVSDLTKTIDHQANFSPHRARELTQITAQLSVDKLVSRDSSLVKSLELIDLIFLQASGVSMDNWDGSSSSTNGQSA